jgi:hypothetical protein
MFWGARRHFGGAMAEYVDLCRLPAVAVLLVSGSLAGCADGRNASEPGDKETSRAFPRTSTLTPPTLTPPSTSSLTPARTQDPTPPTSPTESEPVVESDVPAQLLGTWGSIDSGNAQIYYRFSQDGTYEFLGLFADPEFGVDIRVEAVGELTVTPHALKLVPIEAVRTDAGSTPESIDMPPSSVPWRITPEDVLILETDSGTMDFARES